MKNLPKQKKLAIRVQFTKRMKFQYGDKVAIETGGNAKYLDGLTGTIIAIADYSNYRPKSSRYNSNCHPSTPLLGVHYLVCVNELNTERWINSSYMEKIDNKKGINRLLKHKNKRKLNVESKSIHRKISRLKNKIDKINSPIRQKIIDLEQERNENIFAIKREYNKKMSNVKLSQSDKKEVKSAEQEINKLNDDLSKLVRKEENLNYREIREKLECHMNVNYLPNNYFIPVSSILLICDELQDVKLLNGVVDFIEKNSIMN